MRRIIIIRVNVPTATIQMDGVVQASTTVDKQIANPATVVMRPITIIQVNVPIATTARAVGEM